MSVVKVGHNVVAFVNFTKTNTNFITLGGGWSSRHNDQWQETVNTAFQQCHNVSLES